MSGKAKVLYGQKSVLPLANDSGTKAAHKGSMPVGLQIHLIRFCDLVGIEQIAEQKQQWDNGKPDTSAGKNPAQYRGSNDAQHERRDK